MYKSCHVLGQVVCSWPPTKKPGFHPSVVHMGFVLDKVVLEQFLLSNSEFN